MNVHDPNARAPSRGEYHQEYNLDDFDEECSYPYFDEGGRPLPEKVRFKLKPDIPTENYGRRKTFRWRRFEHGKQVFGRGDEPHAMYRLPELAGAFKSKSTATRIIVEGEKDVHSLLALDPGALVTTAPSTRKLDWPVSCNRWFKDTDVVIVRDNDDTGQRYCDLVGSALSSVARSVRVLSLFRDDDPPGADLTDWLEQQVGRPVGDWRVGLGWSDAERQQYFNGREKALQEFRRLAELAPPWRVVLDPQDPRTSAKEIVNLRFINEEALRTIHRHKGAFYLYTGSYFRDASDEGVKSVIWQFLGEHADRLIAKKPAKKSKANKPTDDTAPELPIAPDAEAANLGGQVPATDDKPEWSRAPFKPKTVHVNDVFNALMSVCPLGTGITAPAWLGDGKAREPATEYLAVKNGLLHLPTGKLRAPTPAYFNLSASDVAFDPDAPVPDAWLGFLGDIWEGDDASIATLQEWYGLCLSTDTSLQKMLMIIGPPRSGKGTIGRVQKAILGSESVAAPTLASLASEFGLSAMIGKPLAIISDARLSGRIDQSIIVERMLSISGEDNIDINRKYRSHWTGQLTTRIMTLTNEVPRFTDASAALPSRFIILSLHKSYLNKEDTMLFNRLQADLPGILNWALEGYRRLREQGRLSQPRSGDDVVNAMESLASPVRAFVMDRCELKAGAQTPIENLYTAWCTWCDDNGRRERGTKQTFGRDLSAADPEIKSVQRKGAGERWRAYDGIELLNAMQLRDQEAM